MNEWEQLFKAIDSVFTNISSLLLDCERMLETRGYVSAQKERRIGSEQSTSLQWPTWWYPGWLSRHFRPKKGRGGRPVFVSVLLHARRGDDFAPLPEPVVTGGVLHLNPGVGWEYWMAKTWAWTTARSLDGSSVRHPISLSKASVGEVEVFARPLASMTDAATLEHEIVDRLVDLATPATAPAAVVPAQGI